MQLFDFSFKTMFHLQICRTILRVITTCNFITVPSPSVVGKSVVVAVGDVAVLTCNVSGNPDGSTVTIQWKRAADMSAIPGANSTIFEISSSANMSNNGVYTCEVTVSNEEKSSLVIPATVSVNITLTVSSK